MRRKLLPGVRKLTQRKGESDADFSVRKSRVVAKAAERQKTKKEMRHAVNHPSDDPLAKFARVWDKKGVSNAANNGGEKRTQGESPSQEASASGG